MEQRFDHDFSRVRIYIGGAAEQSARDVNAHAYTTGNNIVFGAGRFAPATHEGQRLIAHELTHVVQQSGSDAIYTGRRDKKRGLSTTVAETNNSPATEVIARHGQVLVQREACESLAPPDCSKGTCEEGKQCVGGDWPVCSFWSKVDVGRSGYKGGGGRSGGVDRPTVGMNRLAARYGAFHEPNNGKYKKD
jgi:hypothetical protein